jgi:hypothetical protein
MFSGVALNQENVMPLMLYSSYFLNAEGKEKQVLESRIGYVSLSAPCHPPLPH